MILCIQDSAEDNVSVSYCQLSNPGYKEEQLRRSEVGLNLFSGNMEEFTFVNYTTSSGGRSYTYTRVSTYTLNTYTETVQFYDLTHIQFEPKTSVYFDITDNYLRAKQTGLYAFHSKDVQMTINYKWISNNNDENYFMASVALVKYGQEIKFKVASDRNAHAKGTKLTILKLK